MSEKQIFIGMESHNLHEFVSLCCDCELSLEPPCRVACGMCGKDAEPDNFKELPDKELGL